MPKFGPVEGAPVGTVFASQEELWGCHYFILDSEGEIARASKLRPTPALGKLATLFCERKHVDSKEFTAAVRHGRDNCV